MKPSAVREPVSIAAPLRASLPAAPHAPLRQTVVDGSSTCVMLRDGPVAAQLVLGAGAAPRLLCAFAAGNSGAALWFERGEQHVAWRVLAPPVAIEARDAKGRPLYGIETRVEADCAWLVVRQALLGSVRALRDYQASGTPPMHGATEPSFETGAVRWARDRVDGAAGYVLEVEVVGGSGELLAGERVALIGAPTQATLCLKLRILSGETPLTPLSADDLLTDAAADLPAARTSLAFLAYAEKWLAGSWRFHSYFGRDTLMAVRLLLPVLRPAAAEAALASVLSRLSAAGEVAHEEEVGEYPILKRLARGAPPSARPVFDYRMVDDDFMLLPVAAAALLRDHARGAAFLARHAAGTDASNGALLARNAAFVLRSARAFAATPVATALIRLKPGCNVGDWRDSEEGLGGLGGGVFAYSVNAVLVPAALHAIEALAASGLLAPYLDAPAQAAVLRAGDDAQVWEAHAPALFAVSVGAARARLQVELYAADVGVPPAAAAASVASQPIEFAALALDAEGRAVPVMHSDFGFALLLANPSPRVLARELANLLRPFPAGLMTGVGMLVSNPAFADEAVQAVFGAERYHGTVVWSWQQALWAAGVVRQLERVDLPEATRALLCQAQRALWQAIGATRASADGELWSWSHDGAAYAVRPFGQVSHTADESNVAQLWSTVYLAVQPPPEALPAEVAC